MIKFINVLFLLLLLNACAKPGSDSSAPASSTTPPSNQTPPPSDPDALAQADAQSKITDAEAKIQEAKLAKNMTTADPTQLNLAITGVEKVIASIRPFTKKADIDPEVGNLNLRLVYLAAALKSFLKAKAIEKADATDANADELIKDAENIAKQDKVDANKKKDIKDFVVGINKTKLELATKKAEPTATAKDLETLENKLSNELKELKNKKADAAIVLISDEQKNAKAQANLVAKNAETPLNEVKKILNEGTLSDSKDLNDKQIVLGQALFDFNKLSETASEGDIKSAQAKIIGALNALNKSKGKFDTAEKEAKRVADEKAEEERVANEKVQQEVIIVTNQARNLLLSITDTTTKKELQDIISESDTIIKSKDDTNIKVDGLNKLNAKLKAQIEKMENELKLEEEKAKKAAVPKTDFPYTLLTLEGEATELEDPAKKLYPHYPRQNILGMKLMASPSSNKILIQSTRTMEDGFVIYNYGSKSSSKMYVSNYNIIKKGNDYMAYTKTIKSFYVLDSNFEWKEIGGNKFISCNVNNNHDKFIFINDNLLSFSLSNKKGEFFKYDSNLKTYSSAKNDVAISSAVALKNGVLITKGQKIILYDDNFENEKDLTQNLRNKIKEKVTDENAAVFDTNLLAIADKTLFIEYIQYYKKYIINCVLNDMENDVTGCHSPVLLGEQNHNLDVKVAIANDQQSAFIYAEKNIYYKNNSLIEIKPDMVPTKDIPLSTSSVEGLDPQTICSGVFNRGIDAATKLGDTWYVLASMKGIKNNATDGVHKICKIKEETIEP